MPIDPRSIPIEQTVGGQDAGRILITGVDKDKYYSTLTNTKSMRQVRAATRIIQKAERYGLKSVQSAFTTYFRLLPSINGARAFEFVEVSTQLLAEADARRREKEKPQNPQPGRNARV